MTLAEIMLPEFDREMARTRKVLEAIPADKMDWSPGADLHTIGWNANHLADLVSWTNNVIEESEFDMAPPDACKPEASSLENPADILALFDKAVNKAREAIIGTPDSVMAEQWSLKMGGQVLFTILKGDCIRTWVLNHAVHHRAILSVYLRMAGVELVSVYDQ